MDSTEHEGPASCLAPRNHNYVEVKPVQIWILRGLVLTMICYVSTVMKKQTPVKYIRALICIKLDAFLSLSVKTPSKSRISVPQEA